jgi:hypothetical protein
MYQQQQHQQQHHQQHQQQSKNYQTEEDEYYEEKLSRGEQTFKIAQEAWEQKKAQSQSQKQNDAKEKQKEEYDMLCRRYDKCYHSLHGVARRLSRILETKAKTPIVPPKFLRAREDYGCNEFHPVAIAINTKNNWMWKKIGRCSPFQAVFEKMKTDGYWLKSSLLDDDEGNFFEVSVGFYVPTSAVTHK